MNRIETAVTAAVENNEVNGEAIAPIATVAAVVVGTLLVGAAVGCAEGRCHLEADAVMHYSDDVEGMSVGDLLQSRREAL